MVSVRSYVDVFRLNIYFPKNEGGLVIYASLLPHCEQVTRYNDEDGHLYVCKSSSSNNVVNSSIGLIINNFDIFGETDMLISCLTIILDIGRCPQQFKNRFSQTCKSCTQHNTYSDEYWPLHLNSNVSFYSKHIFIHHLTFILTFHMLSSRTINATNSICIHTSPTPFFNIVCCNFVSCL